MGTSFLTLGIIMLLGAMLPGPDFAIVTKNALLHSRKAGLYTALGIGAATWVHMTYCILGLAVIIQKSYWVFHTIQYAGALYLTYLGIMLLKPHASETIQATSEGSANPLSNGKAFRQGFICNLLNPKATLFFLTLFSTVAGTLLMNIAYAIEMFIIAMLWFCSLVYLISHQKVASWLNRSKTVVEKVLGIMLLGLAAFVIFCS
ncbi:MAG: LysE family translocator [Gammaproteobacteria bacterium]|nr:LysE family translocator [Gammaproteobacteria bacterium]